MVIALFVARFPDPVLILSRTKLATHFVWKFFMRRININSHSFIHSFIHSYRFDFGFFVLACPIAGTDTASHWEEMGAVRDIDQSVSAFLHILASGIPLPARDLGSIFGHRHRNRSLFLQKVLRQATSQFRDDRLTSLATKRRMTSRMEKRRSRYKCDFSRVSIQMILEYFRTRRICGYRVSRMRFGLGGK